MGYALNAKSQKVIPTEVLRNYAERIIAGEFKAVGLVLINQDDNVECFWDGGRMNALGLFTYGAECALYDRMVGDLDNE